MSLNAQLLALLSTPAARSASDDDTRRSVARVIGCEPATAQAPGFNPNELARRRARLARRLAHLQQRIADAPAHALSYDVAEASALQTALVLFDAALAGGEPPTTGAPVHCHECKDLEAAAWRRRAEMDLGDTEEVKGATHMRLRWMLSLTVRQLGADLAAAQRERDEAVAVSESLAGDLSAATDRLASLEHQLDELDAEVSRG